ncbi:MAG: peptide chain release factor family protein [Planctomycetaceae bacterium]
MHPAARPVAELLRDVVERHTRRTGPGGQHRNKVQTAVVLVHGPTGVSAEASERRSQSLNRREAVRRLRLKLALVHRTPAPAEPSRLWRSRIRGRQLAVAADHDDYPALVAEALDHLQACGFEMAAVAPLLGVTSSQLQKLFCKAPEAWVTLGRLRAAAGLSPLK